MSKITRLLEFTIRKEVKVQLGLVYIDIKKLKEENRNLKQKYFDLLKKIKAIEKFLREKKSDELDFGVG